MENKQIETLEHLKIKRFMEEQNYINRTPKVTAQELLDEVKGGDY